MASGATKTMWRIWFRVRARSERAERFAIEQDPHRFDRSGPALGLTLGVARQRASRCGDGVDGVGLAFAVTVEAVRAVDLDHLDPSGHHRPRQPGAIGAGAFDPDPGHRPEALEPVEQLGVAGRCRRERRGPQQGAELVERGGDVNVRVGVDAPGDRARAFYDGHSHPFLPNRCQGVARTRRDGGPDFGRRLL